jgi:hypothetical protein
MSWMVLVRKCIIVLVVFCLIGTIAHACHDQEEEKEQEILEEEPHYEPVSEITESKWFIILDKLIDRYPIIERIIERIFLWIFNNLLDMDY